jgi:hypothetical protein
MTLGRLAVRLLLPAAGALCLAGNSPAWAQRSLKEFVQPELSDVSATIKVVAKNDAELKKMGKSFVEANKLSRQEVQYKEPGRMRLSGKKGLFTIRYVTNGEKKLTQVPTLGINKVENIAKEPAKADTIYDLGLITAAWVDRVEDRWLRTEDRDGKTMQVFEFWWKEDRAAKHTIVVDPATKIIVEHVAHHRAKKKPGFKKKILYGEVQKINGVYVPTKATLLNSDNKIAAILRYDDLTVNSGLSDKLFKL